MNGDYEIQLQLAIQQSILMADDFDQLQLALSISAGDVVETASTCGPARAVCNVLRRMQVNANGGGLRMWSAVDGTAYFAININSREHYFHVDERRILFVAAEGGIGAVPAACYARPVREWYNACLLIACFLSLARLGTSYTPMELADLVGHDGFNMCEIDHIWRLMDNVGLQMCVQSDTHGLLTGGREDAPWVFIHHTDGHFTCGVPQW